MNRLNRDDYTLEDALNEIGFVEGVLDNMGAKEGLTLWGRVVDIRKRLAAAEAALEPFAEIARGWKFFDVVIDNDSVAANVNGKPLRVRDFRRAAAALAARETEER